MPNERVNIYIESTGQHTNAVWSLEGLGIEFNTGWRCVLRDIKGLKVFKFSKVKIEFSDGRIKEGIFLLS